MRAVRNILVCLSFAALLAIRQAVSRLDTQGYVGRHHVESDHLSTMEERRLQAKVQHDGYVALDIHDRASETLPKRKPGLSLVDNPPPEVERVEVPEATLVQVLTALRPAVPVEVAA